MFSLQFHPLEIEQIHRVLGVKMASHDDAIEGRFTKGTHRETLLPEGTDFWTEEGEDPSHLFYLNENGEKEFVDASYARNPDFNNNDYIILDIGGDRFPVDWKIVNLLGELISRGVETTGSDQGAYGEVVDYGYIVLNSEEDAEKVKDIFAEVGIDL